MISKTKIFPEARILVIDDNPENVRLIERVLEHVGYTDVKVMTDSELAMKHIRECEPDLLLLDLRMPKYDGYDVLAIMRQKDSPLRFVPVLVFTADKSSEARLKAFDAGASDFLTKPGEMEEITLRVRNALQLRQMHLELQEAKEALEVRVQARTVELTKARQEALQVLAHASEFRDDVTGWHTKRVGELSATIASELGMPKEWIDAIRLTAPLHDVGKIAVPDSVLLCPEKLDDAQMDVMRRHTTVVSEVFAGTDSPLMKMAMEIASRHHEHWDGSGYPNGLSGDAIPFAARIVAVADVYDALTNVRPYKAALPHDEALKIIVEASGAQFDPRIVNAFLKVVSAGSLPRAA